MYLAKSTTSNSGSGWNVEVSKKEQVWFWNLMRKCSLSFWRSNHGIQIMVLSVASFSWPTLDPILCINLMLTMVHNESTWHLMLIKMMKLILNLIVYLRLVKFLNFINLVLYRLEYRLYIINVHGKPSDLVPVLNQTVLNEKSYWYIIVQFESKLISSIQYSS